MSLNRLASRRAIIPPYPASQASVFRRLGSHPIARRQRRLTVKSLLNLMLLLVEVAAVAGVAWLLLGVFRQWRSLLPLQPSPTLAVLAEQPLPGEQAVLPGAHEAPQGAIPEHLRPLVKPLPALTLPEQAPGLPTRLVIPALRLDAPIVEGDGPEELKAGIGHRVGTAVPGERGNMVLSGHNDVYGELFRELDSLDAGDEVVVYSGVESFTYVVRQTRIVEPDDLSALLPSPVPGVTLISCYPYLVDTHRIVVVAELVD